MALVVGGENEYLVRRGVIGAAGRQGDDGLGAGRNRDRVGRPGREVEDQVLDRAATGSEGVRGRATQRCSVIIRREQYGGIGRSCMASTSPLVTLRSSFTLGNLPMDSRPPSSSTVHLGRIPPSEVPRPRK